MKLAIALFPDKKGCDALFSFAAALSKSFDFSFCLNHKEFPHVSLAQGVFSSAEPLKEIVQHFNPKQLTNPQKIDGVHIWAGKIVFLSLRPTAELQNLHAEIFSGLLPAISGEPADPQTFDNISEEQRASIKLFGYPFAFSEFLPHFTIAHLMQSPPQTHIASLQESMQSIWSKEKIPQLLFEKIAVFEVEPLGICRRLLYESKIS